MGTSHDSGGWEHFLNNQQPSATRRTCPPHTPAITASVPGGGYETECLVCGARGPKRETSVEAKVAFDAALGL